MKLIIEIIEIKGKCPVYNLGDKIVLDEGYRVNLAETDNICMHSLGSILPYYNALAKGVSPVKLGIAQEGHEAYLQCLDPQIHTGGGTVTFRVSRKTNPRS